MIVRRIGATLRMMRWTAKAAQAGTVVLHVGLLCSLAAPAAAEPAALQAQAQFEAAIRNRSTSPNLILLTVVDDRTGESWTGCTLAPLLLGALLKESESQQPPVSLQTATQIALSNTSHVFHFSKQSALDNLMPVIDGKYSAACEALKRNGCMRKPDLTGAFVPC
jgi:hypothetical protein